MRITTHASLAPLKVMPAICNCPMAKPNVPPLLASLTPPVSGLLQPTDKRFALEKFVPANGPTENINGFSGASGSMAATSRSTNIRAIRYRPASANSRPASWRSDTCWRCKSISINFRIVSPFWLNSHRFSLFVY